MAKKEEHLWRISKCNHNSWMQWVAELGDYGHRCHCGAADKLCLLETCHHISIMWHGISCLAVRGILQLGKILGKTSCWNKCSSLLIAAVVIQMRWDSLPCLEAAKDKITAKMIGEHSAHVWSWAERGVLFDFWVGWLFLSCSTLNCLLRSHRGFPGEQVLGLVSVWWF